VASSGYVPCGCRDCMEIAVTSGGPVLCSGCQAWGCAFGGSDGGSDCQVPDPGDLEAETLTERQHHRCCGERITMAELTSGKHICSRADTCNTCTRGAASPFRVYDERGRVVEGCVDDFHTGHLVTPSESARWHNRSEAKAIRRSTAKFQHRAVRR